MAEALRILGVSCVHWPQNTLQIEENEAAVDTTVSCRYKTLDLVYPDSKFIYTRPHGDLEEWCRSVIWAFQHFDPFATPGNLFAAEANLLLYGVLKTKRPELLKIALRRYEDDVFLYFRDREDDLLVYDIVGHGEWPPLCEFLGKPVPEVPFPHRHKRMTPAIG